MLWCEVLDAVKPVVDRWGSHVARSVVADRGIFGNQRSNPHCSGRPGVTL